MGYTNTRPFSVKGLSICGFGSLSVSGTSPLSILRDDWIIGPRGNGSDCGYKKLGPTSKKHGYNDTEGLIPEKSNQKGGEDKKWIGTC